MAELPENPPSGLSKETWLWAREVCRQNPTNAAAEKLGISQPSLNKLQAGRAVRADVLNRIRVAHGGAKDAMTLSGLMEGQTAKLTLLGDENDVSDTNPATEEASGGSQPCPQGDGRRKGSGGGGVAIGSGLSDFFGKSASDADHALVHEMFLPVHGFVWYSEAEHRIIDHPLFQRLKRVRQLGLAHQVYPGATHTRFEHVMGALHVSQRMIEAIQSNHERAPLKRDYRKQPGPFKLGLTLREIERRFIRLGVLLHDIGHLPFGHTLEDELHILNKHDKEDRLAIVLCDSELSTLTQDSLAGHINAGFGPWVWLETARLSISPSCLLLSIIANRAPREVRHVYRSVLSAERQHSVSDDRIDNEYARDLARAGIRLSVCADIVGNTICADMLDYLYRDWHHVGKPRHIEDRLFQYMEIRTDSRNEPPDYSEGSEIALSAPIPKWSDVFVINLKHYPRLRTDAVSIILELLEARYNLSESVLFHRAKLKPTAMLERSLMLAFGDPSEYCVANDPATTAYRQWNEQGDGWHKELERRLFSFSEDSFLEELCRTDSRIVRRGDHNSDIPSRVELATRVRDRQFFLEVLTVPTLTDQAAALDHVQHTLSEHDFAHLNRERSIRQIESDFGLRTGDVTMYCPEKRMNMKIAEVKVLVDGYVYRLDQYEDGGRTNLTGGHLRAQLDRFSRLWRVSFFVHPRVRDQVFGGDEAQYETWSDLLADYIAVFCLGIARVGRTVADERIRVAGRLASAGREGFWRNDLSWAVPPVAGIPDSEPVLRLFEETGRVAARSGRPVERLVENGRRNGAVGRFPTGAESVWSMLDLQDSTDEGTRGR